MQRIVSIILARGGKQRDPKKEYPITQGDTAYCTQYKSIKKYLYARKHQGDRLYFSDNGVDWTKDALSEWANSYWRTSESKYDFCFEYAVHSGRIPHGWTNPLTEEES